MTYEVNAVYQAERSFTVEADNEEEAKALAIEEAEEYYTFDFDSLAFSYVEVEEE